MYTKIFFKLVDTKSWRTLTSNEESKLLIQYKSDKLDILPKGYKITTGLLYTDIKSIFSIKVSNTSHDMNIDNIVSTRDGIRVTVKLSSIIALQDENEFIKRVFLNENEELILLKNVILKEIQKFISDIDAKEVKTSVQDLNKELENNLYDFKSKSCFVVKSLILNSIHLEIKEIDSIHSASLIDKQQREKDDELNQIKLKLSQSLNKLKQAEAESEQKLQLERNKHEILLEKEREMNKIGLAKEKRKAELEIESLEIELQKKKNELEFTRKKQLAVLLKSEEGKLAQNPELWYKLQELIENTKALNLKDQQSFAQEFIKNLYNTKQSFQQGQLITLKKMVEKVFNIQTPDYEDSSTNPIIDSLKNFTENVLNSNQEIKKQDE